MSELEELLACVKAAKGPDRSLDHCIESMVKERSGGHGFGAYKDAQEWVGAAIGNDFNSPRYSSSIEAGISLVERLAPEMWWSIGFSEDAGDLDCDDRYQCTLNLHQDRASTCDVTISHVSHPLAIVAALLTKIVTHRNAYLALSKAK